MNLVPDYSFFWQILTFLVLWICLKRLLFDPVMQVLEAREQRTVGTRARAGELMAIAERDRQEYEQSIHAARARLAQESETARKAALEEAASRLAKERATAVEDLVRLRGSLETQVGEARQSLAGEAETIAAEMLARVSGGVRA